MLEMYEWPISLEKLKANLSFLSNIYCSTIALEQKLIGAQPEQEYQIEM